MPCPHKFLNDLKLENLNFEPTTLIIGTFNPAWPEENTAQWFYGRTHDQYGRQNNNFWDILPRLYGEATLINAQPADWKKFCQDKKIAITDLIAGIDDADENNPEHRRLMGGFADDVLATNFYDFDLVNIVRLLRQHPTITHVYTTRGTQGTFWSNKIYAAKNYREVSALLTPSGFAYREQGKYNRLNPNHQLNLPDFILMRWQQVWHPIN